MDFNDLTNNGVENTPEMEPEKVNAGQETVETPANPASAGFADLTNKAKGKFAELAKDDRIAKGVEKVKKVSKKTWIAIAAVLAVLIVGVFAYSILSNTYKTPIDLYVNYMNDRTHKDPNKDEIKLYNGLYASELNAIYKIQKKSEDYDEELEESQEYWEELVDSWKEKFGDNYKFSYKIEDKEKLDKDDCKDYQDKIRDNAKESLEYYDRYDDFDVDDWSDYADDLGISRSDAKKLVKQQESLFKKMKTAKVTAGYELSVVFTVKGSELDEPAETEEITVYVYKINGRWYTDDLPGMYGMADRLS